MKIAGFDTELYIIHPQLADNEEKEKKKNDFADSWNVIATFKTFGVLFFFFCNLLEISAVIKK